MTKKTWQTLVLLLLLIPCTSRVAVAQQLDEAEFCRLHEMLQPSADEAWRTIPWQTGLLDAQRLAAREKKPIFIWAMDGHPLGCT